MLDNKIKQVVTARYHAADQRAIFTSKPLITTSGKDLISNLNSKLYRIDNKTTRKMNKEACLNEIETFFYSEKDDDKSVKDLTIFKSSKHLVNNSTCKINIVGLDN